MSNQEMLRDLERAHHNIGAVRLRMLKADMSGACEYRKNRYVGRQGADSKKPRLAETKRGVARDDYFYLVEIPTKSAVSTSLVATH